MSVAWGIPHLLGTNDGVMAAKASIHLSTAPL